METPTTSTTATTTEIALFNPAASTFSLKSIKDELRTKGFSGKALTRETNAVLKRMQPAGDAIVARARQHGFDFQKIAFNEKTGKLTIVMEQGEEATVAKLQEQNEKLLALIDELRAKMPQA